MSEKRFQKGLNLSCFDTETRKSYWYACNLCGLLNEQQSIINEQKIAIDEMITDYKNLEKENEYLRKDKEKLKERLRECTIRLDKFNCR